MTAQHHRATTGAFACRISSLAWNPGSSGQAHFKTLLGSRESSRMSGGHLSLFIRLVIMFFLSASIAEKGKDATVGNFIKFNRADGAAIVDNTSTSNMVNKVSKWQSLILDKVQLCKHCIEKMILT